MWVGQLRLRAHSRLHPLRQVVQEWNETSFTSYGSTVVVDADGYNVESYVPGGAKLRLSGTSMASPNVVNLAAKLFALNPALTPRRSSSSSGKAQPSVKMADAT